VTRRNLDTLRSDINNDAAMMGSESLEALRERPPDERAAVGVAGLHDQYVPRLGLRRREAPSVRRL
jgi:hypothetical protein